MKTALGMTLLAAAFSRDLSRLVGGEYDKGEMLFMSVHYSQRF